MAIPKVFQKFLNSNAGQFKGDTAENDGNFFISYISQSKRPEKILASGRFLSFRLQKFPKLSCKF